MKHHYINVESNVDTTMPDSFISQLPSKVCLFMSIQYVDGVEKAKKQLEDSGRSVEVLQTRHTRHPGQIYGCNVEHFDVDAECFVVIGDGMFHPKALLFNNDLPVYQWNPHNQEISKHTKEEVLEILKKKKGAFATFLTVKEIAILVTTKPGQSHLKKAFELQEKYPDKNFYILCMNEVDPGKLIDFPFIEMYINTACPRLGYDDTTRFDKPILSIGDIEGFLY